MSGKPKFRYRLEYGLVRTAGAFLNAPFLYSAALLDGIYSIFGVLDREYNYRLTGEIDQVNRVAYFSLRTLKRIERRKLNDGQGV